MLTSTEQPGVSVSGNRQKSQEPGGVRSSHNTRRSGFQSTRVRFGWTFSAGAVRVFLRSTEKRKWS